MRNQKSKCGSFRESKSLSEGQEWMAKEDGESFRKIESLNEESFRKIKSLSEESFRKI